MIDSHCHLNFISLSKDLANIIKKVLNIYNLSIKDLSLININNFYPKLIKLNLPNPIFPRIE